MTKLLNVASLYESLYSIVEICKKDKENEIEIIVPDKLSLFMEKFLFEKLHIDASFNIKVSTLNRFAKKNIVVPKEKQISTHGSVLLVFKILNENREKFSSLKSQKYSFSYAENIYATISQLKASRITPEEMLKFNSTDTRLTGKIQDLAIIYEQYEQQKVGLLDAGDVFLMSVFSVADGKDNSNLYFVGFDDFTAIQYAIIERLALNANVNVMNYFSTNGNARIYNNEVFSQLKNIAYINELPFEVKDIKVDLSQTKKFLQSSLFGFENDSHVLTDEAIKLFSANSDKQELEFIAREIRSRVIDGENYGNFGVAVFGLENKTYKIQEIFNKYEINYYIDNNLTLNNSVLYKFFVSVFKFSESYYNLTHLIDIINSPFYVVDDEIKRQLIEKLKLYKFLGQDLSKYDFGDDLNEEKGNLEKFLNDFKIEREWTIDEIKETLKQACEKYSFCEILDNLISKNTDLQNQTLISKSLDMVFDVLDNISLFYKTAQAEEITDIFARIASVVKVGNLPLSLDAVKIVDAGNTTEIFKHLFIANCTKDNAPSLKSDCGIILDSEIEKLNFSFKLSPTIAHINKLAKLRLFNLALLFEKSLTISYSRVPSDLVQELLNKIKLQVDNEVISLEPIYELNIGKYMALSEWDYIEYLCKNDKENKKLFETLIKDKQISNLSLENLSIYKDMNTISASQLENYFKCPFYEFLNNALKIKSSLDNDILSFDIGNILHEILFDYYSKNKDVGDIKLFVENKVDKFVEKDERLKVNKQSPVLKNLINEAIRVIYGMNYIDENSLFQTNKNLLEVDFSGSKALKLKNINLIGKIDRIDLCGDVARIVDYKSGKADASLKELYYGNKLQLFLYSCACENWLKKHVVGGFYLPLHNKYEREEGNPYALKGFFVNEQEIVKALDKRLEPSSKSDIVNIRTNKDNKAIRTIGYKELEETEMHRLKTYAKEVSEKAVDEMKSGFIKPTPSDISKTCEYCEYAHICLKDCSNVQYRQSLKINLDSFKRGEEWKNLKAFKKTF